MKTNSSPNMRLPGLGPRPSVNNPISLVSKANNIRRQSIRRSSLATVGRRVSTILGMRRMIGKPNEDKDNPILHIKELPKEARFGATFSDEAQFAMLKGYEDVLIKELSINYPQHKTLLLRNRTPNVPVIVKKCSKGHTNGPAGKTAKPMDVENNDDTSLEIYAKHYNGEDEMWKTEDVFSKTLSLPGAFCVKLTSLYEAKPADGEMKRAKSLPVIGKDQARLIITHRFQNAIDILEALRKTLGQSTISPRVVRDKIFPLRDFNFWTLAWFSEFDPQTK